MRIIIPYNIAFTNVVASFVEETAVCYGADESEQKRMRLLGEEAFLFIIAGIPDIDFHELFHLSVNPDEGGLCLQFSNHGRPMNVRYVPEFSIEDPGGTADGLSLKLLKNLCNELLFRNNGREGWELIIRVKLKAPVGIRSGEPQANTHAKESEMSEVTCRRSVPEDAPGILNLIYNTYRYSHYRRMIYDKDLLAEALGSGQILSVVAVNREGRVVGHHAVMVDSAKLGELGLSMMDPDYRGGQIFRNLIRVAYEEILKDCPNMLFYAHTVTSHKASQVFAVRFTPCLLSLSHVPQFNFIGMGGNSNARESALLSLHKTTEIAHAGILHVPAEHIVMIRGIFEDGGFPADLVAGDLGRMAGEARLTAQPDDKIQHGRIFLESPGKGMRNQIRHLTRELQQDGIATVDLIIPTGENQPKDLDTTLIDCGYFFCGIRPFPDGSWKVVYTNLLNQKFEFGYIQLFGAKANALGDYVRAQYLRI